MADRNSGRLRALLRALDLDFQADLVHRLGQPFTANIGNARIQAIEGNVDWVPIAGLRATAAFL